MQKYLFLSLFLLISKISYADLNTANAYSNKVVAEILNAASIEEDIISVRKNIINVVRDNIDINFISQFVLGKHWRSVTPEQKEEFSKLYEDYLILTYAPKFEGYNNEKYEIITTEEISKNKYISKVDLILSEDSVVQLEIFFIENDNAVFKIVDISGEGISFASTQRSEFSSVISTRGMDVFLKKLKQKVDRLKEKNPELADA